MSLTDCPSSRQNSSITRYCGVGQPDLRQQRTVGTGHRTQGLIQREAQLLIQPQVHRSIRHGALLIDYDQITRA